MTTSQRASRHSSHVVTHQSSDRVGDGVPRGVWAGLPPLLSISDAADLLGLSRSSAYRAAERGELPVIRFSGRMHVPSARLLALLGVTGAEVGSEPHAAARNHVHGERA